LFVCLFIYLFACLTARFEGTNWHFASEGFS